MKCIRNAQQPTEGEMMTREEERISESDFEKRKISLVYAHPLIDS
jgi:predicted NAD-dependent protein-ADP-ribosyltransferase YbiA (DUF1768 family)